MPRGRKFGGKDWVKGQSGNPKGPKPLPEDVKQIRATQPYEVAKIINKVMWMTKSETEALLGTKTDPNEKTPNIERAVAMCTIKCINEGCVTRLNALTDRWLGKVKEVVMVVPAGQSEEDRKPENSSSMSIPELVELMRRAAPQCQSPVTKK